MLAGCRHLLRRLKGNAHVDMHFGQQGSIIRQPSSGKCFCKGLLGCQGLPSSKAGIAKPEERSCISRQSQAGVLEALSSFCMLTPARSVEDTVLIICMVRKISVEADHAPEADCATEGCPTVRQVPNGGLLPQVTSGWPA